MGGNTNVEEAQSGRPPFVVGVGASAGGLEALQRLFEKTKPRARSRSWSSSTCRPISRA